MLQIHVARDGNNEWSGSAENPLATLDAARGKLRAMRAGGNLPDDGVTVVVHGGVWYLDETFVLSKADSGTENALVTYMAAPGEDVTLSGGVPVTDFKPYRDGIMQVDVSHLNLHPASDSTNPVYPFEVFYNGARQDLARWPNHDPDAPFDGNWAYIKGTPEEETRTRFICGSDRIRNWSKPGKAQVHVFPRWDWADCFVGVKAVDADTGIIELSDPTSYPLAGGRRYYVRNVFEELDAPGEWYYAEEEEILYFWPPDGADDPEVVISRLDTVVEMQNVKWTTFKGISFAHSRKGAVTLSACESCRIAAATITNSGSFAVDVDGGRNNSVIGCDISQTGLGGVQLSGGDRKTLTPGNNTVENCHIHHYGRLKKCYVTAVNISDVGNRIAHCLIHDAPHTAVLLHGNDHVIEYNEIHNVVSEVQDAGAFYLGRDWSERGNVLRFNCFHDLYGYGLDTYDEETCVATYESPRGINAVYMDDNASGLHVYGNVFYRCSLIGIMIGGGKDNVVENNIIVESYPAFHMDARWDQFFAPDSEGGVRDYMRKKLEDVNHTEPPYSERYPTLPDVLENPRLPTRNVFRRNIISYLLDSCKGIWNLRDDEAGAVVYHLVDFDPNVNEIESNVIWHGGAPVRIEMKPYLNGEHQTLDWEAWQDMGFDIHTKLADPAFIDPENDDYQLRDDSPAYGVGFERIPMEKIGLYEDELRVSWPVDAERRAGKMERKTWQYRAIEPED